MEQEATYNRLPSTYRRWAIWFIVLAVFCVAAAGYVSWSKATITLTANPEKINQEFIFTVKQGGQIRDGEINGRVVTLDIEDTKEYQATGTPAPEQATAVAATPSIGSVVITNNYGQSQTLVEKTRLALPTSPDVVVARLQKTVTVEPGAQVTVPVYADSESVKTLPSGRLIIPGLWEGLRDKIYAQAAATAQEPSEQKPTRIAEITTDDLQAAQEKLTEELYQKALVQVNSQLTPEETLQPKLVTSQVQEISYSNQAGEQVAGFAATLKLQAVVVVFDESQLIELAKERLTQTLPAEKKFVDLDPKQFTYTLEKANAGQGQATVKVAIQADSMLSNSADFLDKNKLTNKTREELRQYFSTFSGISGFDVSFSPVWVSRTPRWAEKIQIVIKAPTP